MSTSMTKDRQRNRGSRGGKTKTSRRASGICPTSCGSPRQSCTGSNGSSIWMMCSSSPVRALAAGRMSTPTRCMSPRNSSSTRRNGRASPTGPTNWRAPSRPGNADARRRSLPVHADRRRSRHAAGRDRNGERETFNKAPVGVYFGSPGVEADDPYFGGVGPRRTGCISCGKCNIGCGHNAKNKLTTNYLYLAERLDTSTIAGGSAV
jgi:hypothetical protein